MDGEGYLAGMEEEILMTRRERERMRECARVVRGELKVRDAAGILGISERQCGRILSRYKASGAAGLVHAARGRPSNLGAPREKRDAVLERYEERYEGFGPTLAGEKLERDGHEVHAETLRRWLIEAGKWKRRRKRSSHRSQRERKAHFGELVQMDGSHHGWFEERAKSFGVDNAEIHPAARQPAAAECFVSFDAPFETPFETPNETFFETSVKHRAFGPVLATRESPTSACQTSAASQLSPG
jgi:transposase